jgi:acyl-CoA reductase-like NAD-dependent aldehyde dehydrogenase
VRAGAASSPSAPGAPCWSGSWQRSSGPRPSALAATQALEEDSERAAALVNLSSYFEPPRQTGILDTALRAARELHYGTVLINEVPTWRADQMPYGGVRESGNTKEGPPSAVREMTEERLVVIGT